MEENEDSKPFMQLLGQVPDFSDNGSVQNSSPSFQNNSNQELDRLENLQRQAHSIQGNLLKDIDNKTVRREGIEPINALSFYRSQNILCQSKFL